MRKRLILVSSNTSSWLIDRFDIEEFPTKFAAQIRDFDNEGFVDKKNARRMDDCLQYALVSGNKALLDAGLDEEALGKEDLTKIGVLAGSGMGGLTVFQDGVKALVNKGPKKITPFFIPYAITNMGGALLAIEKGFMGPNYSISTACATANYAFHAAANHIRKGEADVMIAGGVEAPIIPVGLGGFVACRALSTNNDDPSGASRPWDKSRDGFVMGEGAGLLVMESLEHALKRGARIHAEYLGGAITCDAHHITTPAPEGAGLARCLDVTLKHAGVEPSEVVYVNAHGTSTAYNDKFETMALKTVFGDHAYNLRVSSTKGATGHTMGAAGGIEAVLTCLAVKHGVCPPTINLETPDPDCDLNYVSDGAETRSVDVAITQNLGFGGHNGALVFKKV